MKKTFVCNESMVITIPIGSLRDAGSGALMPEKFHCVFRDFYKVFVVRGKPKSAGAAQAMTGVFICILGLMTSEVFIIAHTLPSVLFVVSGMVCYAAGTFPNMHVAKLSFSLNIISFFWSIVAFFLTVLSFYGYSLPPDQVLPAEIKGICGLIMSLLVVENILALFLIYWLSQAICRQQFNSLPIILLKQAD